MAVPEFKLVLLGDGGVGKSSFLKRHVTGEFGQLHIPTLGAEVHPIQLHTNCGAIVFNVWDTGGSEKFGGLRDQFYTQAHGALIFFDVTSRVTYKNVPNWHRDICRSCGSLPIVLIGNKVDVEHRNVQTRHIKYHQKHHLQYYDLSVKTRFNLEKPFLWLARRLVNQPNVELMGQFALAPCIGLLGVMDDAHMAQVSANLKEAQSVRIDDSLEAELEEDYVLTLCCSFPSCAGPMQVSCFSLDGEERAIMQVDARDEYLGSFRARLAEHLGITGQKLHLVLQSGRKLYRTEDQQAFQKLICRSTGNLQIEALAEEDL